MKIIKITIFILSTFHNPLTFGYFQNITQLRVSSYDDIIDQYRRLNTTLFSQKNLLFTTVSPVQLSAWQELFNTVTLYCGQQLTNQYLTKNKPLYKAFQLLPTINEYSVDVSNAGLTKADVLDNRKVSTTNPTVQALINQEKFKPSYIQETIIDPLEELIKDFESNTPDEKTPRAVLAALARGLHTNWLRFLQNIEDLQSRFK